MSPLKWLGLWIGVQVLALLTCTAASATCVGAVSVLLLRLATRRPWSISRRQAVVALGVLSVALLIIEWPLQVKPHDVESASGEWTQFLVVVAQVLVWAQVLDACRHSASQIAWQRDAVLGIIVFYCSCNRAVGPWQRTEVYGLVVAAMIIFARLSDESSRRPAGSTAPVRSPSLRRLAWATVCISGLITWPVGRQVTRQIQAAQVWIAEQVTVNVSPVRMPRSYVRTANLRSMLTEQNDNPTQVALRVFAESAPGYLRGRVYDSYAMGQWFAAGRSRRNRRERYTDDRIIRPLDQPPAGVARPSADQRTFELTPRAQGPWRECEIWNDPLRGDQYFVPVETAYVKGSGDYLAVDSHQVVRGGLSVQAPYTAVLPRFAPPRRLSVEERARLLATIEGIDPRIDDLARQIAAEQTTPSEKINAVTDFFHNHFEYSARGTAIPDQGSPLSQFLLRRPPAHCEFFASGAVVLLRLMGVPCRYVTGYVVREASEHEDYWIARNRNAHAWVEAYDDETQRWVVVEATPGMRPDANDAAQIVLDARQRRAARIAEVIQLGRYWLDPRWRQLWLTSVLRMLRAPLIGLGVSMGAYGLWRWVRRRPRGWRGLLMWARRQPDRRLAELRRMDRRVRRYQAVRAPSETLHQFANRLQHSARDQQVLREAAAWYREFAAARYRAE